MPDAVIVGKAEDLEVVELDFAIADDFEVTPSPVTSAWDEVVLVPGDSCPFGFVGEGVADKLLEEASLPRVALEEVEGVWELSEELEALEVDSIVENERLELDDKDIEVDDSVGVAVFV